MRYLKEFFNKENRTAVASLVIMALPMMTSSILQIFFNITDSYFLGKLGKAYLAAPIIAFQLILFILSFGQGFCIAGTTLIAQSSGKKDNDKVETYVGQTIILSLILGAIFLFIGLFLRRPLLIIFQTPPDVLDFADEYLYWMFLGVPYVYFIYAFQAAFQGVGDTVTPLIVQVILVVINVLLDPFLIFGCGAVPSMGVKGAAIATFIARSVAALIALILIIKGKKEVKLIPNMLIPRKKEMALLLKIGFPNAIGNSVTSIGFAAFQGMINIYGTAVAAAFGISNRIMAIFSMSSDGIARATSITISKKLGSGDINGARLTSRLSVGVVLLYLVPTMALLSIFGGDVIKFFLNDPETIQQGRLVFLIVAPSIVLNGLISILLSSFQGAGDTKPVMIMNTARLWLLRLPFTYLLAFVFAWGPLGIWSAMVVANVITLLWAIIWLSRDKWINALAVEDI